MLSPLCTSLPTAVATAITREVTTDVAESITCGNAVYMTEATYFGDCEVCRYRSDVQECAL